MDQARKRENGVSGLIMQSVLIGLRYACLEYSSALRKSTLKPVNECLNLWRFVAREAVRVPQDFIEMQCMCTRALPRVSPLTPGDSLGLNDAL